MTAYVDAGHAERSEACPALASFCMQRRRFLLERFAYFERMRLLMSRRLPWLFPEGFVREADENPVPPGHPFFEDLIEKDESIVAEIEALQLEVLND